MPDAPAAGRMTVVSSVLMAPNIITIRTLEVGPLLKDQASWSCQGHLVNHCGTSGFL